MSKSASPTPFHPWSALSRMSLSVIALVMLASCGQAPVAAGAQAGMQPVVGVQTVQSQAVVLASSKPARISPAEVAQVRPQVSGLILKRLFEEGHQVQAGDSLYQIDPAPFQAALAQAQASLARAEAELANQQAKLKRYQALRQSGAVSQQEYDQTVASQLQAKADVKTAQAQLQTATLNLQYSQVRAPITGKISRSLVTVGALVNANQTDALATITQLDPIYADFQLSSRELASLKLRQQSGALQQTASAKQVQLIDELGQRWPTAGELLFTEVQVDPSTGTVVLRAKFANPEGKLLPGAFVQVQFTEGQQADAILVPQHAVSRNSKGEPVVYVVNAEQKVEQRTLTVNRSVDHQWLVESGLQAGDQLIIDGVQRIRPGMAVHAEPIAAHTTSASVTGAQ